MLGDDAAERLLNNVGAIRRAAQDVANSSALLEQYLV